MQACPLVQAQQVRACFQAPSWVSADPSPSASRGHKQRPPQQLRREPPGQELVPAVPVTGAGVRVLTVRREWPGAQVCLRDPPAGLSRRTEPSLCPACGHLWPVIRVHVAHASRERFIRTVHCCRRGRHSRGRERRAFCPSRNRNSSGIPLAASGLGSLPGKAGPQRVIERDPGDPGAHAACACLLHPEPGCRLSHSLLRPPSVRSAWTSAPLWELSLSPRPVPTWPTSVCDLRGPCTRPSPGRDPSAQVALNFARAGSLGSEDGDTHRRHCPGRFQPDQPL